MWYVVKIWLCPNPQNQIKALQKVSVQVMIVGAVKVVFPSFLVRKSKIPDGLKKTEFSGAMLSAQNKQYVNGPKTSVWRFIGAREKGAQGGGISSLARMKKEIVEE